MKSESERRADAKSRARGAGKSLSITPIGAIFPIIARNVMKMGILGANRQRLYSQKMDMEFLITVMG